MPRKRQRLAAGFQTVRLQPPPLRLALDVDDLLMEILLRLPAKSLSRFKSVCKKWLSLISSDYFCHHHTLRRPKLQPSILLRTSFLWEEFLYLNPTITINGEKKMIPYSPSVPFHDYRVVQACNGLMLLELTHSYDDSTKVSYCIYNPTTRRSREIISTHDKNEHPRVTAMGLAFDPSKSPYYKIVCIRSIGEAADSNLYTYQIEVYDSESRTWKLNLEPFLDDATFDTSGTYWNNAIYWSLSNGERYYRCFDIDKNELKTLSFPQTPPDFDEWEHDCVGAYLQESDGHLYHFELFIEDDEESLIVLVGELVGDDSSQLIFKNHHRLTSTTDFDTYYILRSMGGLGLGLGSGSDGDGTCSLLTCGDGKMRAYSFLDKSYEDILDFTAHPDYHRAFNVQYFQFGEILALV